MSGSRFRDGVLAALPLTPAPVLFGASFGLLAQEAGFGALAAIVMSATTFAGSAQFAAASILETGGGAAAAIIAAVLLMRATSRSASRWRRSSPAGQREGSSRRS